MHNCHKLHLDSNRNTKNIKIIKIAVENANLWGEICDMHILLKYAVSGSGISWAICKSALHSRQITMPAPHHSVFYRPDALPAAQPTASKH